MLSIYLGELEDDRYISVPDVWGCFTRATGSGFIVNLVVSQVKLV